MLQKSAGFLLFTISSAGAFGGTAYYVSPNGNDNNNGTSPSTPWKTISKVNQTDFDPGDSIHFEGGKTFGGSLSFTLQDAGSASQAILITSYGAGRATISSGNANGITVTDAGGYTVSNLNFLGSGMFGNGASGIRFNTVLTNLSTLEHVHIDSVDVGGYGGNGVLIEATNGRSYYRDVRVTNSKLHDNKRGGLETLGPGTIGQTFARTIFDVYVGHVEAANNAWISLAGVDGGLVERCLSYGTVQGTEVGTGFWAYSSSNVTFQFNEVYGIHMDGIDGDGFTLDWDTEACTLQYNYSHDNDGSGLFLASGLPFYPWLPASRGHVVRFNVSENDARVNTYGGISVYGEVHDSEIYNNTVFLAEGGPGTAFQVWEWGNGTDLHVRNNIFVTTGGSHVVQVFAPVSPSQGLLFQGNDYHASGAAFTIYYNDNFYSSLSQFQAFAGQEKFNGRRVGSAVDPQLTAPGGGGIIGDPDLLDTLEAYKLLRKSPLKDKGLNLPLFFGIDPGPQDFYGHPIPNSAGFSVGAHDP